MKNSILLLSLCCVSIHGQQAALAQSSPQQTQTAQSAKTAVQVLPPIRRVGLDILATNIEEFRTYMRKQDRLLHGVAALPYNESDIKNLLASDLELQTKNTGRFWELSFTQFLDTIPEYNSAGDQQNPSQKKIAQLKEKLQSEYSLDAWLVSQVYFAPDQTLVRLILKNSTTTQPLAREDILLEAQASEDKIKAAMGQALSRIVSTIGHDGRVTYTRDNLMAVDFGTERGLQRGQKIIAGYVLLSSAHPQTGEFLRSKRVPLYELKVLEAQQGSALCQITAKDNLQIIQVAQYAPASTSVLLAWKPAAVDTLTSWKEPYDPQTAPILGAAESGFGVAIEKTTPPTLPNDMTQPDFQLNHSILPPKAPPAGMQQADQFAQKSPTFSSSNGGNLISYSKKAQWDSPETWRTKQLILGGGVALGSFAEEKATSFPPTLLNYIQTSSFIKLDDSAKLAMEPYAQYAFYNSSDISGSSYSLGINPYYEMWADKPTGEYLFFGAGVEASGLKISSGNLSTNYSTLALKPTMKWFSDLAGIGKYDLSGDFSLFDLVKSQSIWTLKAQFHPHELIVPQLAFDVGLKRYKKDWIEFTAGMSWDFIPPASTR